VLLDRVLGRLDIGGRHGGVDRLAKCGGGQRTGADGEHASAREDRHGRPSRGFERARVLCAGNVASIAGGAGGKATPSPRRSGWKRNTRRRTNRRSPPAASRAASPPSAHPTGTRRRSPVR